MNPTARIAKNSLVQIIAGVVNKIFGVVLIIYAARQLGLDGFGQYSFVLSMHAIFFIVTDFGLGTLITRDLCREPKQESRYFVNVLAMRVLLSLIAAGGMVGTVALLGHSSEVVILTAITALSLAFTSNVDTCNAVFFARQRMEIPALVSVAANTIRVAASLGALAAGAGVMTLLGIFTLAAAVHFVIILWMLLFFTRPIFSLDKIFWKKMIKEAYPLALANLFSVIYFRIDTVMIASLKGQEAVGYYSAAYRLLEFTMILPAYYCGAIFPVISAAYKTNHQRFMLIYRRSLKYLIVVSLPLALGTAALAPEIINILYGPAYAASIPLLPILMWTLVLISANSISGPFLIAMGRQQIVARLILMGMIFNIIMNAFAIPRFGIQGAAWVTLVSEVINICFFLVVLRKPLTLNLKMIRYFIRPLFAGGVMYGILCLIPGWDLGFKVLLGGVVYCLMIFILKVLTRWISSFSDVCSVPLRMEKNVMSERESFPAAALVSVIVLNYNGEKMLPDCLNSLRSQKYDSFEVIVVDNASTDKSRELIRGQYPEVRLVALDRNTGFCAGNHAGIQTARGDYIALVNNDVILPPEFISVLAGALDSNENAWVAGPRINNLNMDMSVYPYNGTMSLTGIIIQNVFTSPRMIFGVSGAALMFRREPVGLPFDEDYEYFYEDVYLSWRTWFSGHEVLYRPDLSVKHIGSASFRAQSSWYRWLLERNRLMNSIYFWAGSTWLRLGPLLVMVLITEQMVDIFSGRSIFPRWRAYIWILTHLKRIGRKRRILQAQRRVPDHEIMRLMSCQVTNVRNIGGRLLNAAARCWCRLMRLKTWELTGEK